MLHLFFRINREKIHKNIHLFEIMLNMERKTYSPNVNKHSQVVDI